MSVIKRNMPVEGLEEFAPKDRVIQAKRMKEDFIFETGNGWLQGHKGDWLVLIDKNLWIAVEDKQFTAIYKKFDPTRDCSCAVTVLA